MAAIAEDISSPEDKTGSPVPSLELDKDINRIIELLGQLLES
jgi:hypothetical protein